MLSSSDYFGIIWWVNEPVPMPSHGDRRTVPVSPKKKDLEPFSPGSFVNSECILSTFLDRGASSIREIREPCPHLQIMPLYV